MGVALCVFVKAHGPFTLEQVSAQSEKRMQPEGSKIRKIMKNSPKLATHTSLSKIQSFLEPKVKVYHNIDSFWGLFKKFVIVLSFV